LKRFLVAVSVLLNLAIAAGIVWLAVGGGAFRVVRSFLDPAHARSVSQFEALAVAPGDVVFLGDSITAGGNWSELFPGVNTRNRGIGGDTTEGVLERLAQITRGQPARIFLMIGTNDLSQPVPEDRIVANVAAIVERIHAESPGTRIFLQSVLPRAASYRERVESLDLGLRAVAAQHEATWVDLYPLFEDPADGSLRNEFTNDQLHLLGRGYLVWRDAIDAMVRGTAPPSKEARR